MRRVHNWDVQAIAWACAQMGKPFVWGDTDCCSLVRGMLTVIYGQDPEPEAGLYTSLREAVALEARVGGWRGALGVLGATALPGVLYAGTGDVLIAGPTDDGPFESAMPVIAGRYLLTAPGLTVQTVPLLQAPPDAVAYRVPDAR